MKINKLPSLEYLNECFELDFNLESGLKWKERPYKHFKNESIAKICNSRALNKMAGCKANGYYMVGLTISGKLKNIQAHRIVYSIYYGLEDLGDYMIDHIDRNRGNNNISNLRKVTRIENNINSKIGKNSKSGIRGVCFCKRDNKWRAYIRINGKKFSLGSFKDLNDARIAREKAEKICYQLYYTNKTKEELDSNIFYPKK